MYIDRDKPWCIPIYNKQRSSFMCSPSNPPAIHRYVRACVSERESARAREREREKERERESFVNKDVREKTGDRFSQGIGKERHKQRDTFRKWTFSTTPSLAAPSLVAAGDGAEEPLVEAEDGAGLPNQQ